MKKYKCSCGNNTFHLIEKKVEYRTEKRLENVLVCERCLEVYRIQPCSLGGLEE